ncbi:hypothetical protein DFJ74DRAFT_733756 [Hyaloraphidium curvatum]|nr:hypothetical protein DFJ74DRAFT_733756 [Hyaloraphidium curvatum]
MAASASSADDIVEVVFLQEQGAPFRFFRGNIVSRAPDSIFAHHFGPGGLNEGKDELPTSYTLDRDSSTFRRFFDSYLRGHPAPAREDLARITQTEREALAADAAFYGLPADDFTLPASGPAWTDFDLPGVRFVDWTEAARLTGSLRWIGDDGRARFDEPFVVATESTYSFYYSARFQEHDAVKLPPHGQPPLPIFVGGSHKRVTTRAGDPAESAFWDALVATLRSQGKKRVSFVHNAFYRSEDVWHLVWAALLKGEAFPEIGIGRHPVPLSRELYFWRIPITMKKPFVFLTVRNNGLHEDMCTIEVFHVDAETMKDATAIPVLDFLGGTVEAPFRDEDDDD